MLLIGRLDGQTPYKLSACFAPRLRHLCPRRLLRRLLDTRLCSRMDPALGRVAPASASRPCSDSRLPSRSRSIRLPSPLPRFMLPPSSTPATSAPLRAIELRAGVELRVDKPLFVQAASRCYVESACCNNMFQMCFRCFFSHVA
jgi:hypothetical protein